MAQAQLSGTRLEYVVVPIKEDVKRFIYVLEGRNFTDAGGNKRVRYERKKKLVDEPGGFMVYFPRGHCLRIKDRKGLKQYGLDKNPRIINLEGLNDPNSPLGQLMASQDEESRRGAMESLQQQVIKMATVNTGPNVLTQVEVEQEAA